MRERLIELILECEKENDVLNCYNERPMFKQAAEIIADYLIVSGIVPPCQVGQKVWKLMLWQNYPAEIIEGKVSMLQQKADRTWKIRISRRSSVEDITLDEIGKTVFLTREEAERALKGGAKE